MQHPTTSHGENPVITTNHDFSQVGVTFLGHSMDQQPPQSARNASSSAATNLVSAYSMSPMMSATGTPRMSFAGNMVGANTSAAAAAPPTAGLRLPLSMSSGPVGLHGLPPGPRTPDGQPLLSPMGHSPFGGFAYPPAMTALESPTNLLQARLQHSPGFPFPQHTAMHPSQVFFPSAFDVQGNGVRGPPIDKMSWLDAAEIVLGEAQEPLALKDIKQRIVAQGLVGPNARSSLETLMHRDIQKGSKRFKRLDAQLDVFSLMTPEERKAAKKSSKKSSSSSAASSATKTTAAATTTAKTSTTTKASTTAKTASAAKSASSSTSSSKSASSKPAPGSAAAMLLAKREKFRRKSQNLRRLIKALVFENAALCDEVARTEAKLPRARAERRFLLLRLLHYQALTGQSIVESDRQTARKEAALKEKEAEKKTKEKNEKVAKKEKEKEKEKEKKKDKNRHKHKKNKKAAKEAEKKQEMNVVKKKKPSSSLKRHILPIPLDAAGQPIFPIVLGSLTVHSLGEVLPEKSTFHSDRYIYPAGFHSTRVYGSRTDPRKRCVYTCKILNSDGEALFEITDDSDPPVTFSANSASRCHKKLLQAINKAFGEDIVNESRDRAMEFFGFSHPTIQNLIQGLVGASRCASYRWLRFEECKPEEREKIAHWYESDPTVCFQALAKAYKKRMDEKQSAATTPATEAHTSSSSPTTSTTTTAAASLSSVAATAATSSLPSTAPVHSDSHNLRSLLTAAPILTPTSMTSLVAKGPMS
ncbi:uncharacterized protein [Diadema setosum]|uniref:uncharacterized protein n=1 Tax=Diadema setosum TaxID=31175 RepID=UPI003B3BB0B2